MAKVLVIDDEPSVREMVSEVLKRQGHEVVAVSSAREGVKHFKEQPVDLVVTDLVMPDVSGIDMILEMKDLVPEVKILAISGGGGITGRFDYLPIASLVGAGDILKKPFSIGDFNRKVNSLLEPVSS